jgi:hypothetical protein
VKPIAEVWCAAPHGAGGRPHRYRLATIYQLRDGRWKLVAHGPYAPDVVSRRIRPGHLYVECPKHGEAEIATMDFAITSRSPRKPRVIEVLREGAQRGYSDRHNVE